eukprot:NODE_6953_length_1622_cov_4.854181.p1 GENE.NODE_6953_length_1622_cov_4.854181~~NODE_6953_length_1622_cov_4.854181.p1  ORF type:complete len:531 (+),score=127.77 NODE_6953_length_1622_cov_4.854181:146-1594(+)
MPHRRVAPNTVSLNAAIHAWARGGQWQRSITLLCEMPQLAVEVDVVSCNTAISSCARSGKWQHSLALMRLMQHIGVEPDGRIFGALIGALAHNGDWARCLVWFDKMQRRRISPDVHSLSALMSAYRKAGEWAEGLRFVHSRREQLDDVALETGLTLCELGGRWREALQFLDRMEAPTAGSCCTALVACERSGDEGAQARMHDLLSDIRRHAMELLEKSGAATASSAASKSVHLVLALDMLQRHGALDSELEAAFRERCYAPVLEALRHVAGAPRPQPPHSLPPLIMHHSLGASFTVEALGALGLSDGDTAQWRRMAEMATSAALRRTLGTSAPAKPAARELAVWCSYLVSPLGARSPGAPSPSLLRSAGTVVPHGRHAWPEGVQRLAPVFANHSREQHAERRALLRVAERIVAVARCGGGTWADDAPGALATGTVRLYCVHTPCVSCLAVFCQFARLFPRLRLSVAFSTWAETREAIAANQG